MKNGCSAYYPKDGGGTVTDAGGSTISGAAVKIEDETSGERLNNTVTRIIHV